MKKLFIVVIYLLISANVSSQNCNVVEILEGEPEIKNFSCYDDFLNKFNHISSNKIAIIYYSLGKSSKKCIYTEIDTTNCTAKVFECDNQTRTFKEVSLKGSSFLDVFRNNYNEGIFLVKCNSVLYGEKGEGVLIKSFNSTYGLHSYNGSLKEFYSVDSMHVDVFEYFKKYFNISAY